MSRVAEVADPVPPPAAAAALHRVALTVNSSLDIKEVLAQLARLTLEAIPADRCNLFLTDHTGNKLVPTLAIGRVEDPELWHRFRTLDPIDIWAVPERGALFADGRATAISDLAFSPLAPPGLVETFHARSALVAPLIAAGQVVGLITLDWRIPNRTFSTHELELLEAVATYAALAIRNARLYQGSESKARTLGRLFEVASALNSSSSLRSVLDLICAAYEELLGTSHCSVNLVGRPDSEQFQTLSVRGVPWFAGLTGSLALVAPEEVERVHNLWSTNPRPVVYSDSTEQQVLDAALVPSEVRSAALFPLRGLEGSIIGSVVAGFPRVGGPLNEGLEVGQALADLAVTAIVRADLHERLQVRLKQLETLYRLSDVIVDKTKRPRAFRQLESLLAELDAAFDSIAVVNAKVCEAVGARLPTSEERQVISAWRGDLARGSPVRPVELDNGLLVPVVHGNRVQGTLRLRVGPAGGTTDEHLLLAVASGCGEVMARMSLRRSLAEGDRQLMVAAERERIARDLHDSVGQILVALGMRLTDYLHEASDRTTRDRLTGLLELAVTGSQEMRQAIYSLNFFAAKRENLVGALSELCDKFRATSGIFSDFQVKGSSRRLPKAKEDAFFRVAHEALMNVARHARAEYVHISLEYEKTEVRLIIRDEGTGLVHRRPFGSGNGHFGIRSMQERMKESGGTLRVRNAEPHGVIVEARLPVRATRTSATERV